MGGSATAFCAEATEPLDEVAPAGSDTTSDASNKDKGKAICMNIRCF